MQVALLATALTILAYLLARTFVARRIAARARAAAPATREVPGCLVLDGLSVRHLSIDGRTFAFTGVTAVAPCGFSHVPPGSHRVVLVIGAEARAVDAVVRSGETTRLARDAAGHLVAVAGERAPRQFDASYIHFPTWLRGPRMLLASARSRYEDA